jgi:hypothetical protein
MQVDVSWLPTELEPVAMRLGRADELIYQLGQVSMNWSRNGGDSALEVKQVRSATEGMLDAVVTSVRPVPPSAPMLFSEVVNHLRAALDNVVFHLVTSARGQAPPDDEARLVTFPIHPQQAKFQSWAKRIIRKVPELADEGTDLYQRIESLQPYASTADIPSLPPLLAALTGVQPENAHALLLLQSYSNEDKHRAIRLALPRSIIQRSDVSFYESDRSMQPIEIGDILASVREGEPTILEATPALHVERPDTGTWVAPAPELSRLHQYVAHVAIPTLLTGTAPADPPLPDSVDLSDNGLTLAERIDGGSHVNAHQRMRVEAEKSFAEINAQTPRLLRTED